jgi:hypothetical protein
MRARGGLIPFYPFRQQRRESFASPREAYRRMWSASAVPPNRQSPSSMGRVSTIGRSFVPAWT